MLEGACGIGAVSAFDVTGYRSQIAGEVAVEQLASHVFAAAVAALVTLGSYGRRCR